MTLPRPVIWVLEMSWRINDDQFGILSLTHTYVGVHAVFGKGEKVGKVR